jgi:hypothetical protein
LRSSGNGSFARCGDACCTTGERLIVSSPPCWRNASA